MKKWVPRTLFLVCICLALFVGIASSTPPHTDSQNANETKTLCSAPTIDVSKIYGKIQIVNSFPDFKVQVVQSFPDLKVQVVNSFPDKSGKWQMVNSFPDFKIQFVDSFPDFKIKYVSSFPGTKNF